MNLLRGVLFDNLGLKLVALLLAVLVYLNVYTDRPATMMITFPIQIADLADSLSLSGPAPAAVQAELRGTAKQLIRLRVTEPPVRVSLAGVGTGHFERALGVEDLPIPEGVQLQLDRWVSPRTLELEVDRRASREVPVAVRFEGAPPALWDGSYESRPSRVRVVGPQLAVAGLDSVRLQPVSLNGHHDTLTVAVAPQSLPDWCAMDPDHVEVWVPLEPGVTHRFTVALEPPPDTRDLAFDPTRVTAVITAPRRLMNEAFGDVRATWQPPGPIPPGAVRRAAIRPVHPPPSGAIVRYEPDSVMVRRAAS
ncbi:MAG: YbbR-like domain-containing protein [Candidatus Eisenbacteria bacterium]|uniref:YbbR-like domain-containing protein n=1 Tax=Eiseniibacteriota bacterium TaxID=2212470 RepID=A0A538TW55_UNCEI|nr:MAG: YbbR-like domain-containing protein [Candidatus Eisenbacteria bacterium]